MLGIRVRDSRFGAFRDSANRAGSVALEYGLLFGTFERGCRTAGAEEAHVWVN